MLSTQHSRACRKKRLYACASCPSSSWAFAAWILLDRLQPPLGSAPAGIRGEALVAIPAEIGGRSSGPVASRVGLEGLRAEDRAIVAGHAVAREQDTECTVPGTAHRVGGKPASCRALVANIAALRQRCHVA